MTKAELDDKGQGRRVLLKGLSLGGIVAAAAGVLRSGKAEAAVPTEAPGQGYRETQHVATYYKSARF